MVIGALASIAFDCGPAWPQPADNAGPIFVALAAEPQSTVVRAVLYAAAAQADVDGLNALLERVASLRDPSAHTFDPQAAYIRATRLSRGLNRAFAIESVATSFARRDPDAALAWARSLAAKEPGVLGLLVTGFADADPPRALDLALQIDTPAEQTWALQGVGRRAASRDPDAARAYIESHVADRNRREQVLSLLARAQADAVTSVRAPVSAPEPPVVAGQGDMVGRQQRLFAPPPADSRFEPLSR